MRGSAAVPAATRARTGGAVLAFALCVAAVALCATTPRPGVAQPLPDELVEVQTLLQQGNAARAAERLEAFLGKNPKDARGRFLRGVILTEQKRTPEAIGTFTALTEDFPELPEPYNNLAVLFAAQGELDRARVMLELAVRANPGFATAHENLGDIYARLAAEAYDRALQLDRANAPVQGKLALIRELFSADPRVQRPPTPRAEPPRPSAMPGAAPSRPGTAPARGTAAPAATRPVEASSARETRADAP